MKKIHFTGLLLLSAMLAACASVELTPSAVSVAQLDRFYAQWRGTPYRYGGDSPRGVDCSAFVSRAYTDLYGYALPRSTRQQAQVGRKVSRHQLRPGDLVFFRTGFNSRHVGIYMTDGQFIHASPSKGVIRSSLATPYWSHHYWRAQRIL